MFRSHTRGDENRRGLILNVSGMPRTWFVHAVLPRFELDGLDGAVICLLD